MPNKPKKTYVCEIHQSLVYSVEVSASSTLEAGQEAIEQFKKAAVSPTYTGKPRVVTARVKKCSSKS